MTLMVDTPTAATEAIQRGAFYVLFEHLNDAIALVSQRWQEADEEFALRTGRAPVLTNLEPVDNKDFHEGFRPTLISAPIDDYPNVSVMAYRATPAAGSAQYDHQEIFRVALAVEIMVKSSPDEGEEVCNRRAQRMVEATALCLSVNSTLGGIVSGFDGTPTTSVTEMFTRKEGKNARAGREWFWQGGRLEYMVRKEAALPHPHGTNFRAPTYTGLDVDQF